MKLPIQRMRGGVCVCVCVWGGGVGCTQLGNPSSSTKNNNAGTNNSALCLPTDQEASFEAILLQQQEQIQDQRTIIS